MHGVVQVDAGQHGEDVGLQDRNQQLEADQQHVDRRGKTAATTPNAPAPAIITMKLANTSSITWPAIMLANRRTDRQIRRER